MVERRLFVHVGGYDPLTPEVAYRRFRRELSRFARAWVIRADSSDLTLTDDLAGWSASASGPNWSVASDIRLLRWDDVMAAEAAIPRWRRVAGGLATGLDFVAAGALWGYLRFAWRYALFFLYPFVLVGLLAGTGAGIGWLLARIGAGPWIGAPVGALVFAGCLAWAGSRLSLDHLLDDWVFSARYLRHGDPVLGPRLDRLAALITDGAASGRYDEVVVVGHSLGAVLAVDLVDRALARMPALGRDGVPVALVTLGSSIPKIGLHRGARALRASLGRVSAAPAIAWSEYQTLTDPMNFYKTDPVRMLRAGTRGPVVRIVKLHKMLDEAFYRRIKSNFFRVHNQFVSGNDVRYFYDYFMLALGPLTADRQAREPDGALTGIGPDGSFSEPEPAPAATAAPVGVPT